MKKNKTYHIITIGCQMNKSDSERIAGYLEERGFKYSTERNRANFVFINTCGVRQSAEDRVYGLVPKIKKENKGVKIIITGCLASRKDVKRRLGDRVDLWLPITDLGSLDKKLDIPKATVCRGGYLKIEPKYESKFSAFVPIGNGCNNFCTYCVVPYARGREVYRPVKDILEEVKLLVGKEYKEITLIAQNVNSYEVKSQKSKVKSQNLSAASRQINFAQLLKMVNDIPGDFWIRFATSHPKDMSDELIKTIATCEKVCEHIHLPAQAGDNKILRAMNRKYTIEHYRNLIKKIKRALPSVSLTTDIIVGFPGETKTQFNNTAKLFREVGYDMAYIAQYSPRYGTAALKFKDDVASEEKKRREEDLMKILRQTALRNNKQYIDKEVDVLVWGKNKKGEWYGYTRTNKNVKIIGTKNKTGDLVGKFVRVVIKKVQDFGLEGELAEKKKVIVIVGTTASGKTKLGVRMAYKLNGEIISADSRQVYKGMDIGTGKDLGEHKFRGKKIPYHLIDVADPKERFDLARWHKLALKAIEDILSRGKTPIVVGGTGLYAQALVDGYELSDTGPDLELRKDLEKNNRDDLYKILERINKRFAERLNNSEKGNKRRLVRYIEILKADKSNKSSKRESSDYSFEIIGVTLPREDLKKKIRKRLIQRLEKENMVGEVERLRKQGISWKRLESFGLEYKFIAQYLQGKLEYDDMVEKLYTAICQFSKRQMTWLKRWEKQGAAIDWLNKNKK